MSPEVLPDGRVTFRIHAPNAQAVRVSAGDIVGLTPAAAAMTKGENGIWSVTVPTPEPGAYRYNFNVDGVSTIDPRNAATSESFQNTWSVVSVPGDKAWDLTDIPHGSLARVTYKSASLGQFRRMHVYTPPGYENGTASYPVFYLLHGAGDSDDAWTSVGRLTHGGRRLAIVATPLAGSGPAVAVSAVPLDEVIAPFDRIRRVGLVAAAGALVLAVLGAGLSAQLTQPIRTLVTWTASSRRRSRTWMEARARRRRGLAVDHGERPWKDWPCSSPRPSPISVWEATMLADRGRLAVSVDTGTWIHAARMSHP